MSKLFEPYQIGAISFRNRFVRSATHDRLNRRRRAPRGYLPGVVVPSRLAAFAFGRQEKP